MQISKAFVQTNIVQTVHPLDTTYGQLLLCIPRYTIHDLSHGWYNEASLQRFTLFSSDVFWLFGETIVNVFIHPKHLVAQNNLVHILEGRRHTV